MRWSIWFEWVLPDVRTITTLHAPHSNFPGTRQSTMQPECSSANLSLDISTSETQTEDGAVSTRTVQSKKVHSTGSWASHALSLVGAEPTPLARRRLRTCRCCRTPG